jgi:hypothetical protein
MSRRIGRPVCKTPMNPNTKTIGLSRMLKQQFGVDVPVAQLESAVTLGQFQDLVLALVRKPGAQCDERALRERVERVVMVNYRLTFRRAVYEFSCLKCHQRLGVEGVRLGNQRWKDFLDGFYRQNPSCLVSFVRTLHAACPSCGCEYTYHSEDASLRFRIPRGDKGPRPATRC